MPVVTFSKRYLLRLMSMSMPDKELEAQISKLGCQVERLNGDEISIEVSPNRPDLFGAVGFARSLKNFMHRSKRLVYQIEDETPALEINVGKEVGKVRPYIASLLALNLKLDDAALADIINFTEKLCETYGRSRKKIAIGLHDFDQVEPPLHYNAYQDEKFVPLNEREERSFSEVLKTTEKGMKYGYTIEGSGKRYPALKDNQGVLSFIPILNSERTRVTTRTRNILVDMTGMYEEPVNKTSDLLAAMFMDLGAEVKKVEIAYPGKTAFTPPLERRYLSMPLSLAEGEIGVPIGFNNVISLANKMGYEAALAGNDIRFSIPEYRMDVINEQDLVEDVAIAYGYDYIQPVRITARQQGSMEPKELLFDSISEAMLGLGFSEMVNTYLTNEETNFTDMRINDIGKYLSARKADYIRLKNAKAQSITMMRTWILPSLLKNVGMSTHEKMPQRIFELDMAFSIEKKVPLEKHHLAGVSADPRSNFNNMKGTVEAVAYFLRMEWEVEGYDHESFIKGRCAKINMGKETIGMFGELHPEVLNNFGIEEPASAFEINLMPILAAMGLAGNQL